LPTLTCCRNEKAGLDARCIIMWNRFLAWWRNRTKPDDAGAWGEARAERFLREQRGFRTVARNWRNPRDLREEIDLIMQDGEVLVFVEVKARSAGALVPGYYAVTPKKKRILRRVCQAYLRRLRPPPRTFRFDIVEIELPPGDGKPGEIVRHFERVPLFSKWFRS